MIFLSRKNHTREHFSLDGKNLTTDFSLDEKILRQIFVSRRNGNGVAMTCHRDDVLQNCDRSLACRRHALGRRHQSRDALS